MKHSTVWPCQLNSIIQPRITTLSLCLRTQISLDSWWIQEWIVVDSHTTKRLRMHHCMVYDGQDVVEVN